MYDKKKQNIDKFATHWYQNKLSHGLIWSVIQIMQIKSAFIYLQCLLLIIDIHDVDTLQVLSEN